MTRTAKKWRVTAAEIKGCKMGEQFTVEVMAETVTQAQAQVKAMLRTEENKRVNIVFIDIVAVAKITATMPDNFFWGHADITEEAL